MKSIKLEVINGEIYLVNPNIQLKKQGKKTKIDLGKPEDLILNQKYKFMGIKK